MAVAVRKKKKTLVRRSEVWVNKQGRKTNRTHERIGNERDDRIGRLMTVGLMANGPNHWNGRKEREFVRTDCATPTGEEATGIIMTKKRLEGNRRLEEDVRRSDRQEAGPFKPISKAANKPQIRGHLRCQGAFRNTRRWQMGRSGDNPWDSSRQAERDKQGTRSTSEGRSRRRRRIGGGWRRRARRRKRGKRILEDEVTDEGEGEREGRGGRWGPLTVIEEGEGKRKMRSEEKIEKIGNCQRIKRRCQFLTRNGGGKANADDLEVMESCDSTFIWGDFEGNRKDNVSELSRLTYSFHCLHGNRSFPCVNHLTGRSIGDYDFYELVQDVEMNADDESVELNCCGETDGTSNLENLMKTSLRLIDVDNCDINSDCGRSSHSLNAENPESLSRIPVVTSDRSSTSLTKQPSFPANFGSNASHNSEEGDDEDVDDDDIIPNIISPLPCPNQLTRETLFAPPSKSDDPFALMARTASRNRVEQSRRVQRDSGTRDVATERTLYGTRFPWFPETPTRKDVHLDEAPRDDDAREEQNFPLVDSVGMNEPLSYSRTITVPSLQEKVSIGDNTQGNVSVMKGETETFPSPRAPNSQRRREGNSLSCEGLEGSIMSPPFQSVNNEKLPYGKPFRASTQGWSLSFALMMLVMLLPQTFALPAVIRIGAIFTEDQRDSATELAFKYAVYRINNDKVILPNTTLVFDIQYAPRDDSFHTAKKACKQITFGVQAIFGPFEPLLGSHIQSITDALDIPHLEARLDMEPQEKEFSINLYPSHQYLNQAYKDMIQFLKWKKVAIVYEEDFGLMKLQEIIRSPPSKSIEIYIRQGHPENYRDILKEVKHKEIYSIIVDTLPQNMNLFLRCLLQLQMNDYRYHYLFTTFDIETFDLEDFKYNYVNMTAFRLVDTDNVHVRRTLRDMEKFQPIGHSILNKSSIIQAEPALIFDSVNVFAKGLHALERSATLSLANLSCESETPWPDGSSLFNYINAVEYNGVTGPIKFTEGKRSNFKLDILKLRMEKLYKVGEWTPEGEINITDHQAFFEGGKPNITLKVITIEEKPYVMLRKSMNFTGNDRYYGFCIDLLERLAGMTGFNYEIEAITTGRYGTYNVTTGEWDGLVRVISDKKADLAVGSMTINYARESVIDFTKPFMNLGVSILFKIPTSQPTRLFSFMNPLAVEIWLYVLAAYMLVSFTMFVMARFSPYEWNNPHPCNDESDVVENQFTLSNSFWFITGTLLRQGSGLNPKAASTRIVGGIWWFFTLIIISSYTANLAAFLTVERMITPIESAEDLAEQNEIEYGTLEGGSTMAFFRDSKIETYQKMWRYMESKRPSVFVPTIDEGVERVLRGNYAFLMESTMLDYTIQRNCNLTQVGGLLNSNSYGIATPIGSPWRDKISLAILELQEKGIIQMLYSKWWKNTGDVCNRDEKNKDSKANALGVENIGGVFVVLLCGLALAIVVAILEFCWNSRKNAQTDRYSDEEDEDDEDDEEPEYDEYGEKIKRPRSPKMPRPQQSLCSEMAEELRFAMRCQGSRQRPALKRNCSRCTPGTTYVPAANDLPQANGENGLLPMIEFRKSSVVQFDSTSPS